jgi:protein NRD1
MNSAVAELEAGLQGLLTLRPPGVSNSRVNNLTTLCVDNVQVRSTIILSRDSGNLTSGAMY